MTVVGIARDHLHPSSQHEKRQGTIRPSSEELFFILFMFFCCWAAIVFLWFSFLLEGRGAVWKRKMRLEMRHDREIWKFGARMSTTSIKDIFSPVFSGLLSFFALGPSQKLPHGLGTRVPINCCIFSPILFVTMSSSNLCKQEEPENYRNYVSSSLNKRMAIPCDPISRRRKHCFIFICNTLRAPQGALRKDAGHSA